MEIKVHDMKGQPIKSVDLPESIFNVPMNEGLLHLVIKGYQANMRQGTHATKTKGMVAGGGKKPFKQKGTGEARQGSSRSPLNPGGGVTHGPQPRDYREKMSQSLKLSALKVALSDKVRHGKLMVISELPLNEYSTKKMISVLSQLKLNEVLISDERKDNFLSRSARNLPNADTYSPDLLNARHVLRRENLLITSNALTSVINRLSGEHHE